MNDRYTTTIAVDAWVYPGNGVVHPDARHALYTTGMWDHVSLPIDLQTRQICADAGALQISWV